MVRIENESNIEILRQISLLLDKENQKLLERVRKLTLENAKLRGWDGNTQQLDLALARELEELRKRVFESNNKRADQEEKKSKKKPKRGHGPRRQPELPLVEKVHELRPEEMDCDVCGGTVTEMSGQFEESEEITVIKRSFVIVKNKRKKYRCLCNAKVVTAPCPPKLIPGGRYSVEFAVEVATAKYLDHLPLERQVRIMGREGLVVDSQTLWDQIDALATHLEPCYEALGERVLQSPVIHADESGWRWMGSSKPNGSIWSLSSTDTSFYRILTSKSLEAGKSLLAGYLGTVVADGYVVYDILARDGPSFSLANCWQHAKRKFEEASEYYPVACAEVLALIRELFLVDRKVPGPFPGNIEAQELRQHLRNEESRTLVEKIKKWAFSQTGLPRSEFGKAVLYMLERWKGLTVFLDDPLVPLSNNAAERALRGPVVGRKNHYGSRSERGAHVAALFYSLCETAKLCVVEPRRYLRDAAFAAIRKPGAVTMPES
jgi:transposase